ncbi:MAG: heparan-alpha-glucosaminide N-acetyltransferase domain-containing protein [Bacteroidales bacterium]|nr:heparan-alpha-glucosaminide N-acetyltransferase domain-containing protein [Bacteroidales bacterium]MCF8344896.1 heparan-alpha-glucosaminide N-acetyltransferase domain-containing protein [Bacteroidales bacterium]MCF8350427.1 heparan-alpha-glucosaminide N-acetyltransferase domain-containing protein [Bacteroidales bacterium]MCF8377678.1 heparan-alpha-glucosaminide N-acetyltransferase domain-containing protein [Bacteroidales bacterium]MCF8401954.1 heparan-alpha-glucosaminide N-acetyltransferase 
MNERKRLSTPDLLKGVAVILMIQVHLTELFGRQSIMDSLTGKVSLFLGGVPAAPVFMAAMGYLMSYSQKNRGRLIGRGFELIGLGLLLNIGLNLHLLIKIMAGSIQVNPWEYILGVDILFLAGLSIIILSLLKPLFKHYFWAYLLLAFGISLIHPYIPESARGSVWRYIQAFVYGKAEWSYFPLFPWLAYPLLGYAFALLEKHELINRLKNIKWMVMLITLIMVALTFNFGFETSVDLSDYYHHGWRFFLWAAAFLIFWLVALSYLNSFFKKTPVIRYLRWSGKEVTAFYIVQWLIIGNIATAIYKTQNLIELLFWFLAITTVTSLIVMAYTKIRSHRKKGII